MVNGIVDKTFMLISCITNTFYNYSENVMFDGNSEHPGLWDTAVEEEFNILRLLFYPESDVFLKFLFSIIYRSSYGNAKDKGYPEGKDQCSNVPILLVGSVLDLRSSKESSENSRAQNPSHTKKLLLLKISRLSRICNALRLHLTV